MEVTNKLFKKVEDSLKHFFIEFDNDLVEKYNIQIDHIAVDKKYLNIEDIERYAIKINADETGSNYILLHPIQITGNQKLIQFKFQKVEEKNAKPSVILTTNNFKDLHIELQKLGYKVGTINKTKDFKFFEYIMDEVTVYFINTNLDKKLEVEKLITLLIEERDAKFRSMADFQNYKKRIEKQIRENNVFANKMLINHVIEVIDDCNRALNDEQNETVTLLASKLKDLIREQGLKEIEMKVGDKFNPTTMEALTSVKAEEDKKENTIIFIDQLGYEDSSGVVYKPAKVIVAK